MPPARPVALPDSPPANASRGLTTRGRLQLCASAVVGAVVLTGAGCSGPDQAESAHGRSTGTVAASPTTPRASASPLPSGTASETAGPVAGSTASPGSARCAAAIVQGLSAAERAGQLLMVGLDVNARRTSLDRLVTGRHLGGVILLGGWYDGAAAVRSTTRHLAGLAAPESTAGLGLLLAADQEGGAVQQLRGHGFTRFPSARDQASLSPQKLTAAATTMARQLKAAGINVNLAPVADTVPAEIGRANAPIGRWGREFASDPDAVAPLVDAFVRGMEAGGVASTVKHFPGLGRITGNTDITARGITDHTASLTDPHLEPFASAIEAGADLVMVGSAIYTRLDPKTNAAFSKPIVTDLLRTRLGYDGVVITDDVGAAKAVAAVPPADRATRFVAAGGDIVLTARPSTVPAMHDALTARMARDKAFAAQVEAAAERVVDLKVRMGLARCP